MYPGLKNIHISYEKCRSLGNSEGLGTWGKNEELYTTLEIVLFDHKSIAKILPVITHKICGRLSFEAFLS